MRDERWARRDETEIETRERDMRERRERDARSEMRGEKSEMTDER